MTLMTEETLLISHARLDLKALLRMMLLIYLNSQGATQQRSHEIRLREELSSEEEDEPEVRLLETKNFWAAFNMIDEGLQIF